MSNFTATKYILPLSTSVLAIILVIAIFIEYKSVSTLSNRVTTLETKLASTSAELSNNLAKSHGVLADQLNQQKQNVGDIEQKLGAYKQEVGSYSSTVTTLQKLSKTDPQLLAKYSKIFFLNENYSPARLTEIPNQYSYSNTKVLKFQSQAWPYLQKMIDNAKLADITLYTESAYRSFNEQEALKNDYKVIYGSGTANSFSADQGYSEHQLGTTVDFTTTGLSGGLDGFDNTKAYVWLSNNAYHFGFILSYPESNKFYVYEPWHWRFVGVKLATDLHNQNKHFYDLDQRDIDEYLANLFD